jgi:thiamine biosynthesis lipoprotein
MISFKRLAASSLITATLLSTVFGLTACQTDATYAKYTYQFYGTFDTLIQFMGYARSEAEFNSYAKDGEARFIELNQLFDIYHSYEGVVNAKSINDQAGIAPVAVGKELIGLVKMAKEWYGKTGGKCNIAMGPVTAIWKEYRDRGIENPESAELPPMADLTEAGKHCDISKVILDEANGTIFVSEKGMILDLGAVAKGYACEVVALELEKAGLGSVIVDGGGNIRLVGRPLDGVRQRWGVGIQNPDGDAQNPSDAPLDIVFLHDTSFVTSGDYQRFYTVDGKRYCHLVDPATLMPADYFRAVAVSYTDSGIADFMSTTLFLLPYEEGAALVATIPGLEAVWITNDGKMVATDGMKKWMKTLGGATSALS